MINWCKNVIEGDRYVVLDTETTGLEGEIIDLAIIDPAGPVLFDKLLKPTCPIEPGAMNVHHITEEMVAGATTFAEEWPEIEAILQDKGIIAYRAEFDRGRLWQTAMVHGIKPRHTWPWQCLLEKYAVFYGEPNRYGYRNPAWQKLQDALTQQGIDLGKQTHRALWDAQAAAALIRKIAMLGDKSARWGRALVEEVPSDVQ